MAETVSAFSCPAGANAYVLRQGDTLATIAARYGVTVADIRRINPELIGDAKPGDAICVPSLRCPNGTLYVVHKGDTLTAIAKKFGVTVAQMTAANPFIDPDVIAIGQVLCVPVREEEPDTPAPKPDTPSAPESGGETVLRVCIDVVKYTVKSGESYSDLLVKTGLSYLLFRLFNPELKPGRLYVGQEYYAPKESPCCATTAGRMYLLQPGEDLQTAAGNLGVSVGALLSSNPNLAPADFTEGTTVRY
ncbi:MAG: LysM peptidoglycan-binding domain-containing protein [Eubacteriales bacterium]|nr:LysM peptidoglycan-binding domain-containing protein [Eubacteriales bacterium]